MRSNVQAGPNGNLSAMASAGRPVPARTSRTRDRPLRHGRHSQATSQLRSDRARPRRFERADLLSSTWAFGCRGRDPGSGRARFRTAKPPVARVPPSRRRERPPTRPRQAPASGACQSSELGHLLGLDERWEKAGCAASSRDVSSHHPRRRHLDLARPRCRDSQRDTADLGFVFARRHLEPRSRCPSRRGSRAILQNFTSSGRSTPRLEAGRPHGAAPRVAQKMKVPQAPCRVLAPDAVPASPPQWLYPAPAPSAITTIAPVWRAGG